MKRIVITGGHLTPALAVIDELVDRGGWEIHFIGRRHSSDREQTPSVEQQIIQERELWFYPLTTGRFPRLLNRYTFLSAAKIPFGLLQSFYYLTKIRPDAVLSFGGYLSVPVVFWSWVLRIPALTHEQTTVFSLATRINSIFARKLAVSWPGLDASFAREKTIYTGNPVRKAIFQTKSQLWRILKFPTNKPTVLVTGGNQGAKAINDAVRQALPCLTAKANLLHLTGHLDKNGDFQQLQIARNNLTELQKMSYHLKKYVSGEEMGTFLNKADLIVSRGGANTLTEIAALGKPVLVIPYPWQYKDEQTQNALMLAQIGLAEILPQADLSPDTLCNRIFAMINNLGKYRKAAKKARELYRPSAAAIIINEIEKII